MSSIDRVLLGSETTDEFIKQLMASVVVASKASSALPKGSDREYSLLQPEYAATHGQMIQSTTTLIQSLCKFISGDESSSFGGLPTVDGMDVSSLPLTDELVDCSVLYDQVTEIIDLLLEGADQSLSRVSMNADTRLSSAVRQSLVLDKDRLLSETGPVLLKPQMMFLSDIDNSRNQPFRPRLRVKHHCIVPLDLRPVRTSSGVDPDSSLTADMYYPHPYEAELRQLEYPKWCHDEVNRVNPMPTYSQQPFIYVDTEESFNTMLRDLLTVDELAVDLEHHSLHSFQGLTCLMQVSTRSQDYIVDTLALRHMVPLMGQVMSDPLVVKVLHGCEKDVLWLQRDFGVYIVNCFDTYIAAKALHYPALSLAHLLKVHCDVTADKKHQLADWRVRPLSPDMLHYAHTDTRFLLYIYDCVRLELWRSTAGIGALEHVFDASRLLCLGRYDKEKFDPFGFRTMSVSSSGKKLRGISSLDNLTAAQEATLVALWDWRDQCARREDDSVQSIMSNAELLRIGLCVPTSISMMEQNCGPLSLNTRQTAAQILSIIADVTSVGPSLNANNHQQKDAVGTSNDMLPPRTTNGKSSKFSVPPTVYTFTPAVLAPSSLTQQQPRVAQHHPLGNPVISPIPATDEIFRQAGWSTPQDKDQYANSPVMFELRKSLEITEDNKKRMNRSAEEFQRLYTSQLEFASRLKDLASGEGAHQRDHRAGAVVGKKKNSCEGSAVDQDSSGLLSGLNAPRDSSLSGIEEAAAEAVVEDIIPKSFEEIYSLSLKNRSQKSKDKKRSRDGEGGSTAVSVDKSDGVAPLLHDGCVEDPSSQTSISAAAVDRSIDSMYKVNASDEKVDIGVDETLAFASSVGWLDSAEEAESLKESYQRDLHYQRTAESAEEQSSGSSGSAPPIRSSKTSSSETIRPAHSSNTQAIINATDHVSESAPAKSNVKPYLYPKVAHQGAIGALSTAGNSTAATTQQRRDVTAPSGNQRKNKGGNRAAAKGADGAGSKPSGNPFLFGASMGK